MNVRPLLAVVAAVGLGATMGCSTVQVSADYDPAADFAAYTTFDFAPAPEIKNTLVYERLRGAVEAELIGKGLRPEAGSPTLVVALHGRLSNEIKLDTTTYGYGWGRWGYGRYGSGTTTVREVPVGTLIVDLVDAKEKKLVWQGTASDSLDPRASPEEKDRRVKDVVKKMFAGFPPASAAAK